MYLVLLLALLVSIVTKYCVVIFIAFFARFCYIVFQKWKHTSGTFLSLTIKREREMKATASPIILLFWTSLFMLVPWKTFSLKKSWWKASYWAFSHACIGFKDCSITLTLVGHFYLSKFEINGEKQIHCTISSFASFWSRM